MLPSETIALELARGKRRQRPEGDRNWLFVISPHQAAVNLERPITEARLDTVAHLCFLGEFMLNASAPIDQVYVVLPPPPEGADTHVIHEEFNRYVHLWSEYNQTRINLLSADADWVTPPNHVRSFVGGLHSPSRCDAFTLIRDHLAEREVYFVPVSHTPTFREEKELPSAWEIRGLEDFESFFGDSQFSSKRYENWWDEVLSDGVPGERLDEPRFLSNVGSFFGYGRRSHPLRDHIPHSYHSTLMLPNKLRHAGPNPSVCIVQMNKPTFVFVERDCEKDVSLGDTGVGTINALIELLPEVIHDPKIEVDVLYRGLHPDHSSARIHSWQELTIFGVRGLEDSPSEALPILEKISPDAPPPIRADSPGSKIAIMDNAAGIAESEIATLVGALGAAKRSEPDTIVPVLNLVDVPRGLYNLIAKQGPYRPDDQITSVLMKNFIQWNNLELKWTMQLDSAQQLLSAINMFENAGVMVTWDMLKVQ